MDKPPRPPVPTGVGVPIIGQKKFLERVTFELAGFKFHPPAGMEQNYAIIMILLSAASPTMYKTIAAFQDQGKPIGMAYLAEDCELGAKHTVVMIGAYVNDQGEGELAFHVARPKEDDPAGQN